MKLTVTWGGRSEKKTKKTKQNKTKQSKKMVPLVCFEQWIIHSKTFFFHSPHRFALFFQWNKDTKLKTKLKGKRGRRVLGAESLCTKE